MWDTGEYEVIPRIEAKAKATDDEHSDSAEQDTSEHPTQSEMLFSAFQRRHVRLRLHGTRLPQGYTIALRLPSHNDTSGQPRKPRTKRRRMDPAVAKAARQKALAANDDTSDDEPDPSGRETGTPSVSDKDDAATALASDGEEEIESIRANNAYPGSTNSIGSIHQRHWFLTLDRKNSGLRKRPSGRWEGAWQPFFVLGREEERSVVTGRLADDVMSDEGVERFIGRKMWRPIVE